MSRDLYRGETELSTISRVFSLIPHKVILFVNYLATANRVNSSPTQVLGFVPNGLTVSYTVHGYACEELQLNFGGYVDSLKITFAVPTCYTQQTDLRRAYMVMPTHRMHRMYTISYVS